MLSKLEQKINSILNKSPYIKKVIKRIYQVFMYIVSPKIKKKGDIVRVVPHDEYEYFFGYYDKSPWSKSERYMLSLRVKNARKNPLPQDYAEIILIDLEDDNSIEVLGKTYAWNIQQGCMLQWFGKTQNEEIIFNDFRNNTFCSVVLNIFTKEEVVFETPIYDVSSDFSKALSLDFSRLNTLRPGYGYSNIMDKTASKKVPTGPCIWRLDFKTANSIPIMTYDDLVNFEPRKEMQDSYHKVNHIMINESGTRFMFLHRWEKNNVKYTRLLTADLDGNNLYNLSDDNMSSHSFWKSDTEILSYCRKSATGNGYYLMKDKSKSYEKLWNELTGDGHPSYSPNKKYVITDTYPNRSRLSTIFIMKDDNVETVCQVFSPFKYDNEFRCDLHPRWDRNNNRICFDSVFEGKRALYYIEVNKNEEN